VGDGDLCVVGLDGRDGGDEPLAGVVNHDLDGHGAALPVNGVDCFTVAATFAFTVAATFAFPIISIPNFDNLSYSSSTLSTVNAKQILFPLLFFIITYCQTCPFSYDNLMLFIFIIIRIIFPQCEVLWFLPFVAKKMRYAAHTAPL
jgi:hypothetical protein